MADSDRITASKYSKWLLQSIDRVVLSAPGSKIRVDRPGEFADIVAV